MDPIDSARPARLDASARPRTVDLVRGHWVEVLATTILLASVAVSALGDDVWLGVALVCLSAIAGALAVIDARYRRVPSELVYAGTGVVLIPFIIGTAATGDGGRLGRAILAGAAVGVAYLALWRFASMGLGDVRLTAPLAVAAGWSGWATVAWFVVAAHLLAALVALAFLVRRQRGHLPFGPFLVAGLYLAVVVPG